MGTRAEQLLSQHGAYFFERIDWFFVAEGGGHKTQDYMMRNPETQVFSNSHQKEQHQHDMGAVSLSTETFLEGDIIQLGTNKIFGQRLT